MSKVEFKAVGMKYHTLEGETEALKDLSFTIEDNQFVSLIGPSGCGKSTTLSLLAGLLSPTDGQVMIDSKEVDGINQRVAYMLQEDYLFPWRSILDNVLLGLEIRGELNDSSRKRARQLLADYGLGDFEDYYPTQLSGGMRQRVALARTLAIEPDILLLDEPFSALDYHTKLALEDEVAQILREEKKTVILVTHDIGEAIAMSDRVLVFSERPGEIKSDYKIDLTIDGEYSTFKAREATEFNRYFNSLWEELDIYV
ncbi:NitT/TauT family transport system ATP-binding protein [Orenia metallireducens]|uniref:NitT/TauT family transport system ATP-binding protein n=1 Tax=Orenia metallireducens TaxID=1413210 RepID=A0A285HSG8_9FIRM|nr:ABC transporter ATP-binding protein [Orenia metallireducens]PRX24047.1 NitT/TauT family transport system ATP-binding protein [Orenia metallireducens]SNY38678.1 NitT/TauT family transport system ATP-binding protein [Orenia metallireducens]